MPRITFNLSGMESPMPTGIMIAHINSIKEVEDNVSSHLNYSLTIRYGGVAREIYVNVFPNSANFHSLISELYERYGVDPEADICLDDHVNTDVRISLSVTYGANDRTYYVIDWYEPINKTFEQDLPF